MAEETETTQGSYGKRLTWQWIVIYLVLAAIIYGAIYYFVLAKKGGYNNQSANPSQTVKPTAMTHISPSAMMSNEMMVSLAEENNSRQSGTATLTESNGKTTVVLNLTGPQSDVPQPAHIHVGACPGVGAVKYPLSNVVNGKSTTVLDVTLSQLKKELPLAINVHKSAKEITNYTACGELK